ncbi:MAG: hypothetical protein DMD85_23320 [Candidatus Rokuibacteriota bacterium]|nr:MAG: hypothetical protein DMD85_23320 [Candidatus Rokubacteria bacterium]
MCGISGFLGWGGQPADEQIARRMTATLRHRGPDDEGYYVDGPVALGHRRLRVIAPESGRQPLSNEDGSVWAILNGEIYNWTSAKPVSNISTACSPSRCGTREARFFSSRGIAWARNRSIMPSSATAWCSGLS